MLALFQPILFTFLKSKAFRQLALDWLADYDPSDGYML